MKIIVYALGRFFARYIDKIDWRYVIALADIEQKQIECDRNIPVITTNDICSMEYDFIAVFSSKLFEKIKAQLAGMYFIPSEKIVPWTEVLKDNEDISAYALLAYGVFFREKKIRRILDLGMKYLSKMLLTKEELLPWKDGILDGIEDGTFKYNETLYDRIYRDCFECKEIYDAILLWEDSLCKSGVLRWSCEKARYLLLHTSYMIWTEGARKKLKEGLEIYGNVQYISSQSGIFWIVDTRYKKIQVDIAIYVVTHKNYWVRFNELYKPVCVGDYDQKGFLTERKGKNISHLNKKINECTALYWIWKNTTEEYVGLNHYRRYFYNNEIKSMDNYLNIEYVAKFLAEYDIVLPKVYRREEVSVYDQIYLSVDKDLCKKAYMLLRNKIALQQWDYLEDFDQVMDGKNMFVCNMFVTKRKILDRYCQWLFSFLIDAAQEIDVEGYDSYSQRVMGFFAERMWTVWLRKNRLKIKELPYTIL